MYRLVHTKDDYFAQLGIIVGKSSRNDGHALHGAKFWVVSSDIYFFVVGVSDEAILSNDAGVGMTIQLRMEFVVVVYR